MECFVLVFYSGFGCWEGVNIPYKYDTSIWLSGVFVLPDTNAKEIKFLGKTKVKTLFPCLIHDSGCSLAGAHFFYLHGRYNEPVFDEMKYEFSTGDVVATGSKRKYIFPDHPVWFTSIANEASIFSKKGNGGVDARDWDNFSTLSFNEAIALSLGFNPLRFDEFFADRYNYGTQHIGFLESQIQLLNRAIISGKIKTVKNYDKLDGDSLIDAEGLKKYLAELEENNKIPTQVIGNDPAIEEKIIGNYDYSFEEIRSDTGEGDIKPKPKGVNKERLADLSKFRKIIEDIAKTKEVELEYIGEALFLPVTKKEIFEQLKKRYYLRLWGNHKVSMFNKFWQVEGREEIICNPNSPNEMNSKFFKTLFK